MLVDGYNVIGQWARLKKRHQKGDLAGARQLLLDDLLEYNSPRQYELVVVFDGAGGALTVSPAGCHGVTAAAAQGANGGENGGKRGGAQTLTVSTATPILSAAMLV